MPTTEVVNTFINKQTIKLTKLAECGDDEWIIVKLRNALFHSCNLKVEVHKYAGAIEFFVQLCGTDELKSVVTDAMLS